MIIGTYEIAKVMAVKGDELHAFTKDEMFEYLTQQKESGAVDDDEIAENMRVFDARIEFTPDGQILTLMKAPDGVTKQEIAEAIKEGEILGAKDGFIIMEKKCWKLDGDKYVYDTEDEGDGVSQGELKFDDEGLLDFASGMMKLKKIN